MGLPRPLLGILLVLAPSCLAPSCSAFQPSLGPGHITQLARLSRGSPRPVVQPLFSKEEVDDAAEEASLDAPTTAKAVSDRVKTRRLALLLWRFSVVSWWPQVVLSVVGGVTLTFANAVKETGAGSRNIVVNGLALSMAGLLFNFLSLVWTSGYTRFATRIRLRKVDTTGLNDRVAGRLRTGVVLNLIGALLALVSAEQIVGLLISRVLSTQGLQSLGVVSPVGFASAIQPLDIFVVQANTNVLFAHFLSLAGNLWMLRRLPGL